MPEVNIELPEDVERKMKAFPEVDWSKKAEEAITEELKRHLLLKLADETFKNSELSEEDVLKLGKEAKESMHKKFKKEHPERYEDEE